MTDKKISILLAEDNKANQFISKAMIETLGAEVTIAEHGHEVIELLQGRDFDLILMDCQMPEMDGFEATKIIRASPDPKIAGIPIVALTADVQQETRDECLDCGMNDFVSKPFSLATIGGLIKKWVN